MLVSNILAVYRAASPEDVSQGMEWYSTAHTFSLGLSERYGITLRQAAGVVAALSPQLSWAKNMQAADTLCRTGDVPAVLGLSKRKALAILAGTDPDVVFAPPKGQPRSGMKVRAFFACIIDPFGSNEVCVDRHAFDVAHGKVTDDTARKMLDRKGVYDEIRDAYRHAAEVLGLRPHQVQAVTWTTWKRTKQYDRPQHRALYQGAAA